MSFSVYSVFLLWTLFSSFGFSQEPTPPPIDPEDLRNWWTAAGELRMGETAYRVEELQFEEGVCSVDLKGGVMIPVYTGKAPVSERMVGFLYVGDGEFQTGGIWHEDYPIKKVATCFSIKKQVAPTQVVPSAA